MKTVLILMSKTGGGHRASAEAIRAALAQEFGMAFAVHILDLWTDHTPWPLNQVPRSYKFLVDHTPWFYEWLWHIGSNQALATTTMAVVAQWAGRSMMRGVEQYSPDLIVAVHPLLQAIPLKMLGRRTNVPFVTVVTDLATFHATWFHPQVSLCFVPNELGSPRPGRRVTADPVAPVRPANSSGFWSDA